MTERKRRAVGTEFRKVCGEDRKWTSIVEGREQKEGRSTHQNQNYRKQKGEEYSTQEVGQESMWRGQEMDKYREQKEGRSIHQNQNNRKQQKLISQALDAKQNSDTYFEEERKES